MQGEHDGGVPGPLQGQFQRHGAAHGLGGVRVPDHGHLIVLVQQREPAGGDAPHRGAGVDLVQGLGVAELQPFRQPLDVGLPGRLRDEQGEDLRAHRVSQLLGREFAPQGHLIRAEVLGDRGLAVGHGDPEHPDQVTAVRERVGDVAQQPALCPESGLLLGLRARAAAGALVLGLDGVGKGREGLVDAQLGLVLHGVRLRGRGPRPRGHGPRRPCPCAPHGRSRRP
ncbi:hypothetical protein ACFFX0_18025 [Citricoccus parietis]|uniref:Uncharacterized protein n=1 Tax=Citricoccus parietis TaxID=592307 RepID=A0ABV5G239_9MICC